MLIMFIAASANTFLTPFYLIEGINRTGGQAGLLLAAISTASLVVGPASGWLSDKIGSRILCTVGMTLICIALFFMGRLGTESSTFEILTRLIILGIGLGMFSSPNNSAVMGAVPKENLSTASAMIATVRQIGISCGIAIVGAIYAIRQAFHSANLAGENLAPVLIDQHSLVSSFQDSLTYAAIFCTIGIAASWVRGKMISDEDTLPAAK